MTRVDAVAEVTSRMREIWLRGPALAHLRCSPGAHAVVRIPGGDRPARRVYSFWRCRPEQELVVLRVVIHGGCAPGCRWARTVRPGDLVGIERPRTKITLEAAAGFHLFIGDETGAVPLQAMQAALAQARPAIALFETGAPGDEIPSPAGTGSAPLWVYRDQASPVASRVLLSAVRELSLPPAHGAAYIAGESSTCRLLARHLIEERGWPRQSVRVQQQWARGRPGFGAGPDDPPPRRPRW